VQIAWYRLLLEDIISISGSYGIFTVAEPGLGRVDDVYSFEIRATCGFRKISLILPIISTEESRSELLSKILLVLPFISVEESRPELFWFLLEVANQELDSLLAI
jgi:hypothetical protein